MIACRPWQCVFFFFSSRRRHTRFDCDWSSDVCSSDLQASRTSSRYGPLFTPKPPPTSGAITRTRDSGSPRSRRSEEHTSELQSQSNLVCRLLLEKKKTPTPHQLYQRHCTELWPTHTFAC